jgi:citrate synthase
MIDKRQEIKAIMSQVWGLDVEQIPDNAEFNEILEWDSLGHVSLVSALQEKYGFEIDYEVLTELTSIDLIVSFISN